jgi:Flp pilus assembly protein TadD
LDLVKVKGKGQAVGIYEMMIDGASDPELARFLEIYHQGRALYRSRQFRESEAAFAEALRLRENDIPTRNYLELSKKYQEIPPGPEWEAVRTMDGK